MCVLNFHIISFLFGEYRDVIITGKRICDFTDAHKELQAFFVSAV